MQLSNNGLTHSPLSPYSSSLMAAMPMSQLVQDGMDTGEHENKSAHGHLSLPQHKIFCIPIISFNNSVNTMWHFF